MSNKVKLILTIVILGPGVLLSYYIAALNNPAGVDALWGGIPENLKVYYPIGMLIATIGFFPFTYLAVFKSEDHGRYILPYLLILIPSIAWMPLTVNYISYPSELVWMIIRIVLILVPIGAILLLSRMRKEHQGKPSGLLTAATIGLYGFIGHTLILDGIIWPYYF